MSLKPIPREILRGLKAQTEEANRINQVNSMVMGIYSSIVEYAKRN